MTAPPLWFWNFWHWSTEACRAAALLRSPIQGIGSHWDEWYRHEASVDEHHAIDDVGRSTREQRRFIRWLVRHWAREAEWRGDHPNARFVLGQLATLPPFVAWHAFARYRTEYGVGGVAAVVLEEGSQGEPPDVRAVEALAIPADNDSTSPSVAAEGFAVDAAELRTVREATRSLLQGRGLVILLALWAALGRRPYPKSIAVGIALGWVAVVGLVLWLLVGPDPGANVRSLAATLTILWAALAITAIVVTVVVGLHAWRYGRLAADQLERTQLRLRMEGGLSLVGGSAGLPFAINALLAVLRRGSEPRSWLWERVERGIRSDWRRWAATGVVTATGRVRPVALDAKLRACLRHGGITRILIPRQADASERPAPTTVAQQTSPLPHATPATTIRASHPRLGFARETPSLRSYRCRHVAEAVLTLGNLTSPWQTGFRSLTLVVSVALLAALPDLRHLVLPEPAPNVVAPFSLSPYRLWVSLDTRHPDAFSVVLESEFWANRRAPVLAYGGAKASARAELSLHRLSAYPTGDIEDGTVWVERRRRFLTREFAPGERVGRYSLSYVTRLQ